MSGQFSDLQIARISLFGGAAIGAVLTIIIPGPQKLVFFKFQLICTILGLLSLLMPKSKLQEALEKITRITDSN